jgi:tetratricopeptide (TPR) repeat protein
MLNGNHEAVEQNYRQNLDLDPQLAAIFGNSALIQGNTELAHEAYRQAIKLENNLGERAINRHGLALIYADQGKWEQANDLFLESMHYEDNPMFAMMWFNNAIAQTDEASAIKMVQDWSINHPTHISTLLTEVRYWSVKAAEINAALNPEPVETEGETPVEVELTEEELAAEAAKKAELTAQLAEINTSLENAKKGLTAWLKTADQRLFTHPKVRDSRKILAYSYLGDFDKAGALLDSVKVHASTDLAISFAAAHYYALSGKPEEANKAMADAVRLSSYMAGFALTLK